MSGLLGIAQTASAVTKVGAEVLKLATPDQIASATRQELETYLAQMSLIGSANMGDTELAARNNAACQQRLRLLD